MSSPSNLAKVIIKAAFIKHEMPKENAVSIL
jgi:hypothetical protein